MFYAQAQNANYNVIIDMPITILDYHEPIKSNEIGWCGVYNPVTEFKKSHENNSVFLMKIF